MKKLLLLLVVISSILILGCEVNNADAYKSKSKSFITAQEFVKQKLTYPQEADFNNNVVHEVIGEGNCIILGKVIAKNAFSVRTEYVYKIWLSHNGQDWTELSNWTFSQMIIEDTNTKEQSTFYF